jgi:hypothetical protein
MGAQGPGICDDEPQAQTFVLKTDQPARKAAL